MPRPSDKTQSYCTEINSLGFRCSHRASIGDKCAFHDPKRRRCAAFKEDGSRCIRGPMIGTRTCAAHAGYTGKLANEDFVEPPVNLKPEDCPFEPPAPKELDESLFLLEIADAQEFARAVLESRDFREYIFYGVRKRDIPSTVVLRLMDYAWGKPTEHVEHTGKDGKPIESVTVVRRVLVRAPIAADDDLDQEPQPERYSTH
jgi:hypothetical protein